MTDKEVLLVEVDKVLDEYEHSLGLPAYLNSEVEEKAKNILNLPPTVLRKMSASECGEAAFCLRQFSFFLQRATNREQGRVTWVIECMRRLTGSSEERRAIASKLEAIRVKAVLRIDRVAYLSSKSGDMAKSLESLQFSKRGQHEFAN